MANPSIQDLLESNVALNKVVATAKVDAKRGPQGPAGVVAAVVAGTGIAVNNANPARPVVSVAA